MMTLRATKRHGEAIELFAGEQRGRSTLLRKNENVPFDLPFSLSRLVEVTSSGQVVYKAEKDACRPFPNPEDAGLARGPKRNFQILSPLDFLAEFTQHIPAKGSHLIRYYGWYSNKARGVRAKAAAAAVSAERSAVPAGGEAASVQTRSRSSQTWAMLIKRVYEVDPLACSRCGGRMKVIAFVEPPQQEVIEKILRHCGLWDPSPPRGPPAGEGSVHDDERQELTYVDEDTFWATF
ncbi:MAG: hypothetical protein GXY83_23980 [Rhodopirellula sp.]|nr:hypothetical protein [Rhodopirellula sp.]